MTQESEARPIDHRKLLRLRQERNWSQRKVANEAGMEPRQYARYERGEVYYYPGREDTHTNLKAIAALFGLGAEDLLGGHAPSAPHIDRPEERLVLRRLLSAGKPIPIQGPWRFGKATLLGHVLRAAKAAALEPLKALRIDIREFAEPARQSFNAFLRELGLQISARHEPALSASLFEQGWQGAESAASKLGWFLHDHVLKDRALVILILEHMERLQETPFHDAMFAMLRGWAESAVKDPGSYWPRLRIAVTIATESEFLETVGDHSGFFAAAAPMIKLGTFTLAQCAALAEAYGLDGEPKGLAQLHELVDGQPYLVNLALSEAALRDVPLAQLLADVDFRGGIFEQHLSTLRQWLEARHLEHLVPAVLRGEKLGRRVYCEAYSMGLLKETRHNEYQFHCNLYRTYFGALCQ